MTQFHPFLLQIKLIAVDKLEIEAQFMGLRRTHTMAWDDLPLTPSELEKSDMWVDHGRMNPQYAKDFGTRLAAIIFQGDVQSLLDQAESYIDQDEGLRLMLQLPTPAVAQSAPAHPLNQIEQLVETRKAQLRKLPWELMRSVNGKYGFFAQSREVALARHNSQARLPNHPPDSDTTLRVLIIDASTTGIVDLDKEKEIKSIRQALGGVGGFKHRLKIVVRHITGQEKFRDLPAHLLNVRRYTTTILPKPTRANIERAMQRARSDNKPFHIVHFIGHGESDNRGSFIYLNGATEEDPVESVPATEFINHIYSPDLNLLFINACESAAPHAHVNSVTYVAQEQGIPVTIGMRIRVFDQAAVYLARDFYTALAAGEPVESALASARMLTERNDSGKAVDWAIPLLFMGWSEGLTLPKMKHRPVTWFEKLAGLFVFLMLLAGYWGTLLDIPKRAVETATTAPGIKCLGLHAMDENKFTVAFFNFAVVDEEGNMVITNDGRNLAHFLYNRFAYNFEHMGLAIPYELRPPDHTCAIYGQDDKTRAERAERIARAIKADVLIYGTIINARTNPRLKLDFHVSSAGFEEGNEILGTHALGGLLKVNRPFDPDQLLFILRPAHVVRTDILNQVIFGLSYFSVDNYELAAHFFRKAAQTEGWPNADGKEVVYLLLGNALLRQAAQDNDPLLLDEAETTYQKAQAIAPANIRAKIGLAGVLQSRAVGDVGEIDAQSYKEELFCEAEQSYLEALQMATMEQDQEEESIDVDQIQATVDFALGQIYYNRWARDGGGHWREAEKRFKAVVEAHESGRVYQPYRAGRSYGYLASIERQWPDLLDAERYYQQAINMSSPFWQSYYSCRLSQVYCMTGKDALAEDALQSTVDIARLHGYSGLVDFYTIPLDQLASTGCFEFKCATVLINE